MTDQYDQTVAGHYAAYRPPLHQRILQRALPGGERFSHGVDVGCGAGHSSIALADFCRRVYAIDSSEAMLDAAISHGDITYLKGCGERIPLPDNSIDIVAFAGSLFYLDADATAAEIHRVGRTNARIVVYDFEILIDELLQVLGLAAEPAVSCRYDHRVNFSGVSDFTEMLVRQERIDLDMSAIDLAHILLADAARHDALATRYATTTPLEQLASALRTIGDRIMVQAEIYYSTYRLERHR